MEYSLFYRKGVQRETGRVHERSGDAKMKPQRA
jgi:hypothetical protein